MQENQPSGYIGNKNAAKPENEKKTARLGVPCTSAEKLKWEAQAKSVGKKTAPWLSDLANAEYERIAIIGKEPNPMLNELTYRESDTDQVPLPKTDLPETKWKGTASK